MKDDRIKILLVEDDPVDAELIQDMLSEIKTNFCEVESCDKLSKCLEFLGNKKIDLILLDLSLPDSWGLDTLTKVYNKVPYVPIVILTGLDDESSAIQAAQMGAQDYLVKGQIGVNLLMRVITYAIERKRSVEELRQRERELSVRNRLAGVFLAAPDEEVYSRVLQIVLDVLDSKYGTFGYFDQDRNGDFVVPYMTRNIWWEKCNVRDKDIIFARGTWGGIWGRAIKERMAIYSNSGPFNTPEGHVPIKNTMVVPLIYRDEVISAIHVANKSTDYTEQDKALLEDIANYIAPVLNARLQRDREEKERKRVDAELRKLSVAIEQNPASIVIADPEGNMEYVNPKFTQLTGYSFEEAFNQNPKILKSGIHPEKFYKELWNTITSGKVWRGEFYNKKKNGEFYWESASISPIKDDEGRIVNFVAVKEDITERKRAEETIKQLAKFPTENPNPVLRITKEGVIQFANKASRPIWEAWNAKVGGLVPEEWQQIAKEIYDIQQHKLFEITHYNETFSITIAPVSDSDYLNIYGYNITAHKKTEESLKNALAKAKQREKEIAALLQAAQAVLDSHQFVETARTIYGICKDLIGATVGYVALLTSTGEENEVLFLDSGDLECTADPSLPMPIRGLRAEAYSSKKTLYNNDFLNSEHAKYMPEGHASLHNVLFAPLLIEKKVVGVIGLANKPEGFDNNDARVASAFGDIAAVALRNSRTLELLEESELRFRSVTQTATDAIISVDSSGKVILWNKAAEEIFNYSKSEIIGKPVTKIIPERFRKRHNDSLQKAVSRRVSKLAGKTMELVGLKKDGSEFPIDLSLATWSMGEEMFFTGIVRDVTERKQAEQALKDSEKQFRTLVENIPGIVYRCELHIPWKMEHISSGIYQLSGYPADDFIDGKKRNYADIVFPEDLEKVDESVNQGVEGHKAYDIEYRVRHATGGIRWVHEKGKAIYDKNGEPIYLDGVIMDISERKEVDNALKERQKEIEILNATLARRVQEEVDKNRQKDFIMVHQSRLAAMGEMIGLIAHQWRQPLNAINLIIYNIKDMYDNDRLDDQMLEDLTSKGISLAKKMSTTIDDFRNFFKPKNEEKFNINRIVNDALLLVDASFKYNNISVELNEQEEVVAVGFPNEYSQVILNILNNARDAIVSRKVKGEIKIDTFYEDKSSVVRIRDNGGGIAEGILNTIFDPYFTTKEGEGTGIGLYIARVIIEEHMHGCIEVQNVSEGVEFKISTPVS